MMLCACLMLSATSACATVSTGPETEVGFDACLWVNPIGYDSTVDSPDTVKAIEAHNSKWACICEDDCPG